MDMDIRGSGPEPGEPGEASDSAPGKSPGEVYRSRGVYYFPGRVKCPMAGVGSRGDFDSNRLALDDNRSKVTIDRDAGRIVVYNEHFYARKTVVADLMFLANGTTVSGGQAPFGLHLKVQKAKNVFSVDLHRHLRSQEPMVTADFEPFEVIATDGIQEQRVLSRDKALALICRPSLALRVVKAIMAMRNHLDGVTQDPAAPGFRVADLSVGFGALGLKWMVARAQLESLRSSNAALMASGSIANMLREGAWALSLTAFSERWLPEVVQRDLFLFGLDQQPLLHEVRERGLRKGQTLSFRFEQGHGEIVLDGESEALPQAMDVARAYLEFHMLGGLIMEEAERATGALRGS